MPLRVDDVPLQAVESIAADVVAAVSVKRSVWNHWNLMAEASKQTMDLRFATTADREAVIAMIVDAAQGESVALTPPELAISPVRFQREDGTSVFRPRYSHEVLVDRHRRGRATPARQVRSDHGADGAAGGSRSGSQPLPRSAQRTAAHSSREHHDLPPPGRPSRRTGRGGQDDRDASSPSGVDQ